MEGAPVKKPSFYITESVGDMIFHKCKQCPFMSLNKKDIENHWRDLHAKEIDVFPIRCPGCSKYFETENVIKLHLTTHHKMEAGDVDKLVENILRIERDKQLEASESSAIPEVIEIAPDIVVCSSIPQNNITVITEEELQKLEYHEFEKMSQADVKHIIKEASINILYTDSNQVQGGDSIAMPPPEQGAPKSNENPDEKHCSFPNCDVKLHSTEKMLFHVKCHQNGKFCCPECQRFFIYIEPFHIHLWKLHNIDMELYSCQHCPYKTFSKSRLLNLHNKTHKKELPFICPECSKDCKTSRQLQSHKLTHRKVQNQFPNTHPKEKLYRCDQCSYSVASTSAMKLHQRSHNGEKPYICPDCDFRTGDHNSLRRHKKRHTQEKTYKCQHCTYSCIQASTYKGHMKTKHPGVEADNYYACPFCNYKSVNRYNYITHLRIHNNQEGAPLLGEMTMSRFLNGWVPPGQEEMQDDCAAADTETTKAPIEIEDEKDTNGNFEMLQSYISGQEDNNSDCVLLEGSEVAQCVNGITPTFFAEPQVLPPNSTTEVPLISLPPLIAMSDQSDSESSGSVTPVPIMNNRPTLPPFQNQSQTKNISVKSNLILKGPDEVNIFHSQQKMAFKRLEDNQLNNRINMAVPSSTEYLNLSSLYASEQADMNNVLVFPNDGVSGTNKTQSPPVIKHVSNQQNIKMETNQSLPYMNYLNSADEVRLVSTEELLTDYGKATRRLDMSKAEMIKNEHMAEMFANNVNLSNLNMVNCLQTMDSSMLENFNLNYPHSGNMDYMVLPASSDLQPDVIEIDDTSNDMKLLPNINLALSMDYINSVCDMNLPGNFIQSIENNDSQIVQIKEKPRIISEVFISSDKSKPFNFGNLVAQNVTADQPVNFMHGVNDPMMNSSVRPAGSKLSVKNIETMINIGHSRD